MKKEDNKGVYVASAAEGLNTPDRMAAQRPTHIFPTYSERFVPTAADMRLEGLAEHAHSNPEAVRKALIELVKSIPDEDLANTLGAQVTLVT